MQKEHKRYGVSAARLFSSYYASSASSFVSSNKNEVISPLDRLSILEADQEKDKSSRAASKAKSGRSSASAGAELSSFAERYLSEVAPASRLREYEAVATTEKEQLLKEAASLHKKYSAEVVQSQRLQASVLAISGLVSQFAGLLEGQAEQVTDIGHAASEAAGHLTGAEEQLLTTIERSQSSMLNMLALVAGLAIMLLLLHLISP
jgi:hypothetical protein